MVSVWDLVCSHKQVRKRNGMWEVVVFDRRRRSWVVYAAFASWARAVWVATGEPSYRPEGMQVVATVAWQP